MDLEFAGATAQAVAIHRLLEAVCHELRRFGSGYRPPGRGPSDSFDLYKGAEGKTFYTHGQPGYSKNKNAASEMNMNYKTSMPQALSSALQAARS